MARRQPRHRFGCEGKAAWLPPGGIPAAVQDLSPLAPTPGQDHGFYKTAGYLAADDSDNPLAPTKTFIEGAAGPKNSAVGDEWCPRQDLNLYSVTY